MASLVAKSPCADILPREIGSLRLTESSPVAITWLSAFDGQEATVSMALESLIGIAMPAPNRTTAKGGTRAVWCGPGQALVLGPPVVVDDASSVDQSDGWAVIVLEGEIVRDVLSRLTPLDLRERVFKRGHTSRTLLNHITVSLTRTSENRYEIMLFRSMAATAVHELSEAAERVLGRA